MFNKRQAFFGAVAIALVTFFLTASGFMYFFHLVSGDVLLTVKFFQALQVVKSRYVENVPVEKLMNGAISGLVRSLGDPHSLYMDGKMFKQFMVETEGQFGGIGVIVGVKDKMLTVVAPIAGTPGEAAGIKSGDKILKIGGEDTKDMPLDAAVSKIRGPKDTMVELELLTMDNEEKTVKIVRSNIKLKTVASKKLEDNIGYIRITMFNEHTYADFAQQLAELDKEGIKGLVLDLRDNPGGLLDSCVKVAGELVPKGPVVSVVSRDGSRDVKTSSLAQPKYKIIVLVNHGSASASEIVAGAVQDTGVGKVLGVTTYGKGSVQAILSLDGNSAIKLTTATYFTPSGRAINGVGVKPDIELKLSSSWDNQLYRAQSELQEELAAAAKKNE